MSECVRYAPLIGAREGEIDDEARDGLARHLASCQDCRARLADDVALEGLVAQALMWEASRRDFSGFADEVMEKVERRRPLRRAWRGRRALALGSALIPALAALALVVYLRAGAPAPQPSEVELTSEDHLPMVLETSDGPLVLLGDDDGDGT